MLAGASDDQRPSPSHLLDHTTSRLLDLALAEDIATGDVTSSLTVPAGRQANRRLLAKAAGVISGLDVAGEVFRRVDPAIPFTSLVADSDSVVAMTPIATVEGPTRSLLTGERVALNLLQRLSGVATVTSRYVAAVRDTAARIVDTRKTTLGLRAGEGRGASWWRAQPPIRADRRRADQGQPLSGSRRSGSRGARRRTSTVAGAALVTHRDRSDDARPVGASARG